MAVVLCLSMVIFQAPSNCFAKSAEAKHEVRPRVDYAGDGTRILHFSSSSDRFNGASAAILKPSKMFSLIADSQINLNANLLNRKFSAAELVSLALNAPPPDVFEVLSSRSRSKAGLKLGIMGNSTDLSIKFVKFNVNQFSMMHSVDLSPTAIERHPLQKSLLLRFQPEIEEALTRKDGDELQRILYSIYNCQQQWASTNIPHAPNIPRTETPHRLVSTQAGLARQSALASGHIQRPVEIVNQTSNVVSIDQALGNEVTSRWIKYALSDKHKNLRFVALLAIDGILLFLPMSLSAQGIDPLPGFSENIWKTSVIAFGIACLDIILAHVGFFLRPSLMHKYKRPNVENWGIFKMIRSAALAGILEGLLFQGLLFGLPLWLLHGIFSLPYTVVFPILTFVNSYMFAKLHGYGSLWARIPTNILDLGIYFLTGDILWPIFIHFFYDLIGFSMFRIDMAAKKAKSHKI